ncbi:hypothetical protein PRZ48_010664 [Zasmidium cellare]|uniref:Uncharacterized protein n=1 Tax=Zasmidium cellare TaxID=395010 RepID=A0ABR0E9Q8_ZASCE|nr:hypothetical protein PRZ48_010664 [Zasmidium cellare]
MNSSLGDQAIYFITRLYIFSSETGLLSGHAYSALRRQAQTANDAQSQGNPIDSSTAHTDPDRDIRQLIADDSWEVVEHPGSTSSSTMPKPQATGGDHTAASTPIEKKTPKQLLHLDDDCSPQTPEGACPLTDEEVSLWVAKAADLRTGYNQHRQRPQAHTKQAHRDRSAVLPEGQSGEVHLMRMYPLPPVEATLRDLVNKAERQEASQRDS